MNNDLLKSDTPENWTREQERNHLFTQLETEMIRQEVGQNYLQAVRAARQILRLQMELMIEKTEIDGKKYVLIGNETNMYKEIKKKFDEIEEKILNNQSMRTVDPLAKINNQQEYLELIREIRNLFDELFTNNTRLGLNYKKKDDPMQAYYGKK
jgi:hypothetical protein